MRVSRLREQSGQAPGKTPACLEAGTGQLLNGQPAEDQLEAGIDTV
jgi:hypothetical protein